jgi:endoglycosylceramidase
LLISLTGCGTILKSFKHPDATKTTYIRDDKNRICIYHGLNISNYSKADPNMLPWQTEEDIARMNTWGFNLVRLLVFWEAIEPTKGQYNEAYLDSIVSRIDIMKKYGIDVFLDIHQDVYGDTFKGNGFPSWTLEGVKLSEFKRQEPWNLNYTQPAVIEAYQYFWKSEDLRKRYLEMLKKVMTRVDTLTNVIGVDVMNEPFPGVNLCFEKNILSPFYEQIYKMFQEQPFHKSIFFEPWMSTSAGIPTNLTFNKGVFTPHYYDPLCHEGGAYWDKNLKLMKEALKIKVVEAEGFKTPILFGEIGIGKTIKNYKQYITDFINISDQYTFGWTWYAYDMINHSGYGIIDDQKNAEENLSVLVRIYPQKIAGENPKYSFNNSTFTLSFNTNIFTDTTVIFVPFKVIAETSTGEFYLNGKQGYYVAKKTGQQMLTLKIKE